MASATGVSAAKPATAAIQASRFTAENYPGMRRAARAALRAPCCRGLLLELDRRARFLELRLDRVRLLFVHALLHGVGRAVDEVLGLLEAEARDRADDLDHLDLLAACGCEDDI